MATTPKGDDFPENALGPSFQGFFNGRFQSVFIHVVGKDVSILADHDVRGYAAYAVGPGHRVFPAFAVRVDNCLSE